MKYGATNFHVKPLLEEIQLIGELGFDYVELSMDPPEATPEGILTQKNDIQRLLDQYHMELLVHLPTFVSMADLYKSIRDDALQQTLVAMEVGRDLGVRKMVVHPPYVQGLAVFVKEKAKSYALESLNAVYERSKELDITLCLENLPPKMTFWTEPDEYDDVFFLFPDLKLTLDIGHANIGNRKRRWLEFLYRFRERLCHLHVSDNTGRGDHHLPIGAGYIKYPQVMRELRDLAYDDTITVEVFAIDREHLRVSREKIRAMFSDVT
jgi:sugar phosphate isomerase/epimerase